MAKFKVNKTKYFTIMSNYHLKEKNMSLKAKGLLSVMLSLPEDWDYSIAGLVAISLENESAIKSALSELKKFGYLEIIKLMPGESGNGRIDYIYNIYEKPKQKGKKQGIENLPLENLDVEILDVENQTQLNTNNKNTNNKILNNKILNNNIYDYLQENLGRTLSPIEYEKVESWEDNELTRYAVKKAVLNGKYNISYIDKIIYSYKRNGIVSVQQAIQNDEEFKNRKNYKSNHIASEPEWMDKKAEVRKASDDELAEMKDLLKDF